MKSSIVLKALMTLPLVTLWACGASDPTDDTTGDDQVGVQEQAYATSNEPPPAIQPPVPAPQPGCLSCPVHVVQRKAWSVLPVTATHPR